MLRAKVVLITLFLITFFGFFLRQRSLTSFHLYPDSYRFLWQAEKFLKHQPLILDEEPTHSGYSFLSAISGLFVKDLEEAARLVSFLMGVLAIPLVYLCAKEFFQSQKISLLASLIFAGSFNHSAWSGFVLPETSAIFFLLLTWVLLKRQNLFWAGLAQVISISCRMEYALLILPTLVFFFNLKRRLTETIPYLLGLGLPISIFAFISNPSAFLVFLIEKAFFYRVALVSFLVLSALCFRSKFEIRLSQLTTGLAKIIRWGLLGWLLYTILLIPTRAMGKPLAWDLWTLKGWGDFALSDPLLVFLGLAGLSLIANTKPRIGFFLLASALPLFLAYQQTNPISHRYLVHLAPILAMSAAFFTDKAFRWSRLVARQIKPAVFKPAFALAISLFVFGFLLPVRFVFAHWHPEENYEKLAAYRVEKIIQAGELSGKAVLATFSFAPYSFYTSLPVKKIAETAPYLSFEDAGALSELALVVVDEAVRDQRSEFAFWAEQNLKPFLIEKAVINALYLYADYSYYPEKPVGIYLLPTIKLENLLKE